MKTRTPILLALLLCASCKKEEPSIPSVDCGGFSEYVWENVSDRPIQVTITSEVFRSGRELLFNLAPGDRQETGCEGGIAHSPFHFGYSTFSVNFYESGIQGVYEGMWLRDSYKKPKGYDPKCDPTDRDAYFVEPVDPEVGKECFGMRYTYRFTEGDYQAAKAMSEAGQ